MTKEKIASQALIRLGAGPITDFTANTREAQVVSNMYDTVKESLFAYANWNFATVNATLAQLNETIINKNYNFVYSLPTSIVKAVSLYDSNGGYDTEYSIENGKVYSNLTSANLEYIEEKTEADFPPFFTECLVAKLAYEMAEAITGISNVHERLYAEFNQKLRQAKISDGQENPPRNIVGSGSLIRAHQGQYIVRS